MSYGYSKSNLTELDKLQALLVNYQLEFENYQDNYGLNNETFKNINSKFHILQFESDNMNESEKIDLANIILNDYKDMINNLPESHKKRFTINEDNTISYNWDMSFNKNI